MFFAKIVKSRFPAKTEKLYFCKNRKIMFFAKTGKSCFLVKLRLPETKPVITVSLRNRKIMFSIKILKLHFPAKIVNFLVKIVKLLKL